MSEFDAQQAFETLLEKMDEGFNRISDKIDEHIKDDANQFKDLDRRVTTIETRNRLIGGTVIALGTTTLGAIIKWILGS